MSMGMIGNFDDAIIVYYMCLCLVVGYVSLHLITTNKNFLLWCNRADLISKAAVMVE